MEEIDNKATYAKAELSEQTQFQTTFDASLLGGIVRIDATTEGQTLHLIHYYSWDNREAGPMKVWMDYQEL